MIDLELSAGERICRQVVEICQENGIAILFSSHDFDHTPPAEEMMRRFELMSAWGADIAKLAVMPQTAEDVLALMKTGWQASARMAERCPIVAISMGKLGAISRVSGRVFGSCMTFATVQNASAPGQLSVEAIRSMLAIL